MTPGRTKNNSCPIVRPKPVLPVRQKRNDEGNDTMQKLINTYRAAPTYANKVKLQAYLRKHPMAVCMLLPAEFQFLRNAGFNI